MGKTIIVKPEDIVGCYEPAVDLAKSQPKLKDNEYQCAACGEIYEYAWSDEEAQTEYETKFPKHAEAGEAVDTVCDDCYKQMTAWKSPEEAEAEL